MQFLDHHIAMWPRVILNTFEAARRAPDESAYHGPYNKLLYTLFPGDSSYYVTFVKRVITADGRVERSFALIVELEEHGPVFFVSVEPHASDLAIISKREEADILIRQHYADMINSGAPPIPTLHGVCAFGTRLCFYRYNKATGNLEPPQIHQDGTHSKDTAPLDQWNCDLLDDKGEARFRAIVAEVQEMGDTLEQCVLSL